MKHRHCLLNPRKVPGSFFNRKCWVSVFLGGSKRYSLDRASFMCAHVVCARRSWWEPGSGFAICTLGITQR